MSAIIKNNFLKFVLIFLKIHWFRQACFAKLGTQSFDSIQPWFILNNLQVAPGNSMWCYNSTLISISMRSTLTVHGVRICEFVHPLRFIGNAKINTHRTFGVTHRHVQRAAKCQCCTPCRSRLGSEKATLCLLVAALLLWLRVLFVIRCRVFLNWMLSVGVLFRMAPDGSAEVLSGVPKHMKAVMCLYREKYIVLLAMSLMLMNQQYIKIKVTLSINTQKTSLYTDPLITILWPEALRNLT